MLVITAVYENGKNVTYYRYMTKTNDSFFAVYDTRAVTFNIKDTDSDNMYRGVELKKILNEPFLFNVLGVIKDNDSILFVPLDVITWKILDYIDEVKDCGVVPCIEDLLSHTYKDIKYIEKKEANFYSIIKYSCSLGTVYTFKLNCALNQIDKLGIFWMYNESTYITFYYFYQLLNLVENQDCIAFYVSDRNDFTLKLDLNKDINRLLTKFAIMKDKVHW